MKATLYSYDFKRCDNANDYRCYIGKHFIQGIFFSRCFIIKSQFTSKQKWKQNTSTSHIDISMTCCLFVTHISRLDVKCMTENYNSAIYFDLLLWNGRDSQLCTSLYDKRGRQFQFSYYKLALPKKQYPIFACMWCFLAHQSSYTSGRAPLMIYFILRA